LDKPEYAEFQELNSVKVPIYHAYASSCVGLKKFAMGRELVDSSLDFIKPNDPYKAVMLLVKCDLLEKEAEQIEKSEGDREQFGESLKTAIQCAEDARVALDEAGVEFQQHPLYFKPDTCIVSCYLTWGKMDDAERVQESMIKKMQASGFVSQPRIAFQIDEFADICLDSGRMEKAEKLYLDAIKVWEGIPGIEGQANLIKAKCELAHKIYFADSSTHEKGQALFEESRQFTEKHMITAPKVENMELRVQKAEFTYDKLHLSGGVEASLTIQIRCKRRIEDKKPRLPANSKLICKIREWDNEKEVLVGSFENNLCSSFSAPLPQELLDNEDRSKRVVDFIITGMRPMNKSYILEMEVLNEAKETISKLQQHVVSYVDCPNSTLEQAKKIYEQHLSKVGDILG